MPYHRTDETLRATNTNNNAWILRIITGNSCQASLLVKTSQIRTGTLENGFDSHQNKKINSDFKRIDSEFDPLQSLHQVVFKKQWHLAVQVTETAKCSKFSYRTELLFLVYSGSNLTGSRLKNPRS